MRTAHNIIQEYFPELQEDLTTEDYSKIEQALNAARKEAIDEVFNNPDKYLFSINKVFSEGSKIFIVPNLQAIENLKNSMK